MFLEEATLFLIKSMTGRRWGTSLPRTEVKYLFLYLRLSVCGRGFSTPNPRHLGPVLQTEGGSGRPVGLPDGGNKSVRGHTTY